MCFQVEYYERNRATDEKNEHESYHIFIKDNPMNIALSKRLEEGRPINIIHSE
jgi:hypothetical protein